VLASVIHLLPRTLTLGAETDADATGRKVCGALVEIDCGNENILEVSRDTQILIHGPSTTCPTHQSAP
jgi:hypothetical protein